MENEIILLRGPVAQLDRVPDFESEGQEFESLQGHHLVSKGERYSNEVKNKRIWERMAKLIYEKGMYINFVKVKGHSSDLLNDLADRGATNEIERRKYEIMGM